MRITKYEVELSDKGIPRLVKEKSTNYDMHESFRSPERIYKMLNTVFRLGYAAEEKVYMLCFNTALKPTGVFEVSHGIADKSFLGAREIILRLLLTGATSFVLAHNHPGGNLSPSKDDIMNTNKLKKCSDLMDIKLIDHLIVTKNGFFSMYEKNILS